MLEAVGGTEMLVRVVIALLIFAALMLAFWGIRRLFATRSGGGAVRGRQPRLAIIDVAAIDRRRRLLLVRRDNVEHLLMVGGPSDLLIEANIGRSAAAAKELAGSRMPAAEAPSRSAESPAPPRAAEEAEPWQIGPAFEPGLREAPLRPEPMFRGEAPPRSEPRVEPIRSPRTLEARANMPPEVSRLSSSRGEASPPMRSAAAGAPSRASLETANLSAEPQPSDAELTEMAQRLEAALRRPMNPQEPRVHETRPEPQLPGLPKATASLEAPADPALPFGAPSPGREAAKIEATRSPGPAAPFGAPPPREASKNEPRPAAAESPTATEPKPEPKPSPRSVFDSLEQEMASLLGRPAAKD